jgi:hypothetical protein
MRVKAVAMGRERQEKRERRAMKILKERIIQRITLT